jgi:hypothetical protein
LHCGLLDEGFFIGFEPVTPGRELADFPSPLLAAQGVTIGSLELAIYLLE